MLLFKTVAYIFLWTAAGEEWCMYMDRQYGGLLPTSAGLSHWEDGKGFHLITRLVLLTVLKNGKKSEPFVFVLKNY